MTKLLVIADDLTGANDAGVQFARKGIPVLVLTGMGGESSALWGAYQIVVVNTESRHLDAEEAGLRVRKVVEQGRAAGVSYFYKKTDSTLRGNIGSELEALMVATGQNILGFIPAFPELGRTTQEGVQYIDGRPVHETDFALDPLDPISDSFIPAIIARQTHIPSIVLRDTETVSTSPVRFDEAGIYIIDATTDAELQRAGQVLKKNDLLKATAGSSGFAACLTELFSFKRQKADGDRESGRMLVISGSVNQASIRQTANVEARGFACVTLSPEILLAEDGNQFAPTREAINEIIELDQKQREVILRSVEKAEDVEHCLDLGRKRGLDLKQIHCSIVKNIAEIAAQVLNRTGFGLLTVFGGDTLSAIARERGWIGLLPREELLPGVVVSRVSGNSNAPTLITKAGGFGSEDVLIRIKDMLGSRNNDDRNHNG